MAALRLEGMVALVTGAGGGETGGMGAGISRCLARDGARVAVNDLTEESALATVEQLRAMGAEAWPVVGDVSDQAQAAGMVAATAERFGQLDILVNNAGVTGTDPSFEEYFRVMSVNLNGPFFTCRAAVPLMLARGFGRIINIATLHAEAYAVREAYPMSKGGLLALTRHLAGKLAPHGITVNAIQPGITRTRLGGVRAEEGWAAMAKMIPTQRVGLPEDIGYLAAFLASREARQITGAAIPVDGGWMLFPADFGQLHSGR